jgi:hypothetical protein
MANIYDFDVDVSAPELMPPVLRQNTHKAWFKVLLKPIQYLWALIFQEYKEGLSSYAAWTNALGYSIGVRVRYTDKAIYECIQGAFGNTQSPINTLYWVKIQDNFIGANERVKYNSQIIVFEYALNKWFINLFTPNQIYITNNATSSQMLMGQTSAYSSPIAANSIFSTYYMGNAYTPTQYDFTINFPIALFNALPPALNADKEKLIRNFADKYKLAGMTYNIITY